MTPSALPTINPLNPKIKLWIENIPSEYRDVTIPKSCRNLPKELIELIKNYVVPTPIFSLYFFGIWGAGKTTMAFGIIRYLLEKYKHVQNFYPKYLTGRELNIELSDAAKVFQAEKEIIQKFSEYPLLFIDDIDKCLPFERLKLQLFEIFNNRSMNNLPMIITSNLKPDDLSLIFDGSILSRMGDRTKWAPPIEFPEDDLRRKKHENNYPW